MNCLSGTGAILCRSVEVGLAKIFLLAPLNPINNIPSPDKKTLRLYTIAQSVRVWAAGRGEEARRVSALLSKVVAKSAEVARFTAFARTLETEDSNTYLVASIYTSRSTPLWTVTHLSEISMSQVFPKFNTR